jgi:hypothetical protein
MRPGHVDERKRDERAHENGNDQHRNGESELPASGETVSGCFGN